MTERRGYKKIPLVEFEHIYRTDLQNSFRIAALFSGEGVIGGES